MGPIRKHDRGLSKKALQIIGILFAICFLGVIVFFIWKTPCPTTAQYLTFRLILSLSLGILASLFLTGEIEVKYKIGITATSGCAILVMFLFLDDPKKIEFLGDCRETGSPDSIRYSIQLFDTTTQKMADLDNSAELIVISSEIQTLNKVSNKLILGVGWGGEVVFYNTREIQKSVHLELRNESKYDLVRQKYLLKKGSLNEIYVMKKIKPPPPPSSPSEMAGTVYDTYKNTVSNVRVYTLDGSVETRTDANGHFRFRIKTNDQSVDLFFNHPTMGKTSGTYGIPRMDIAVILIKDH